jgi:hypothetical protein
MTVIATTMTIIMAVVGIRDAQGGETTTITITIGTTITTMTTTIEDIILPDTIAAIDTDQAATM